MTSFALAVRHHKDITKDLGISLTSRPAKIQRIQGMTDAGNLHFASYLKAASIAHSGTKPTVSKKGNTFPDVSMHGVGFQNTINHHE